MRRMMMISALLVACATTPAAAMTRSYAAPASAGRAAAVDPDERLSRLAAASSAHDSSHAKPDRSMRNILKDDPYLRAAYASLDNK